MYTNEPQSIVEQQRQTKWVEEFLVNINFHNKPDDKNAAKVTRCKHPHQNATAKFERTLYY